MDTIKIFENYGCLAAEKRSVYTVDNHHATAAVWDELTVSIPDGWDAWETCSGATGVTAPWGADYLVREILAGDKEPIFQAIDDHGKQRRVTLKIIDIRR